VGAMYSLAFATDNVEFIVTEALKTIPEQSDFYKCMNDVIQQYKKDPNDWKAAWFKVERDWSQDIGCPDGVFSTFNIDAKVNAAYIIIGLLYGHGDFGKTLDISMRCGQDSDCNPASAGGILGTMMGYSKIPDYWKEPLKVVEDMDFKYTTISLNDVYKMGFEQALKNIEKNGGKVNENDVLVKYTIPEPVKYEKSFENHYPVEYIKFDSEKINLDSVYTFEGTGVVVRGYVRSDNEEKLKDYVAELEVVVDDQAPVKAIMPLNFTTRKHEIFWMYNLQKGKHTIKLKWLNPNKEVEIKSQGMLIYSDALQNRAL